MDRNKNLAKNTVLLGLGQFVPKLMAMVTLPILTTYLTKTEYGIYDLANSMVSLIVPIMTLQIQQVAFRYLILAQNKEEKQGYLTSSIVFLTISTLIVSPLIMLVLYCGFKYNLYNSFLICTFLISESIFRLFGQLVRGLGYNLKYSIGVIVFSIFQLVFSYVFLVILHGGVAGVFWAFTLSYILAIVYMFIAAETWKYIKISKFSYFKLKEMLGLSVPIVPSSISLWIVNLSNRLVITSYLGVASNAVFAVANKIPNLFSMAYTTFNLAWTESATLAVEDRDQDEYYSNMTNRLFDFLTGIMLVLICGTPILFRILINQQYKEAFYLMPILFFGVFFNSIVQFYGAIYVAIKRTKQVGVSSAVGAVLNLVICIGLINYIGLYAAAFAMSVSYFIICIYRMIDLKKIVAIRYKWKRIVISMLLMVVSSLLCYIDKTWTFAINAIIAIMFNIVVNGNMLMALLKMLKARKDD